MRISDWSSDVCSSDLPTVLAAAFAEQSARSTIRLVEGELLPTVNLNASLSRDWDSQIRDRRVDQARITGEVTVPLYQGGGVAARVREAKQLAGDRKSVGSGKRGSVRVDIGGRRIMKKKTKNKTTQ